MRSSPRPTTAGVTRYEVVDWKTSRRQSADPLQLAIYRVAYAELAGVPLERGRGVRLRARRRRRAPAHLPDRSGLEALLGGTDVLG